MAEYTGKLNNYFDSFMDSMDDIDIKPGITHDEFKKMAHGIKQEIIDARADVNGPWAQQLSPDDLQSFNKQIDDFGQQHYHDYVKPAVSKKTEPKRKVKLKPDAKVESVSIDEAWNNAQPTKKPESSNVKSTPEKITQAEKVNPSVTVGVNGKIEEKAKYTPEVEPITGTEPHHIKDPPKIESPAKVQDTLNQAAKKTEMPKWLDKHMNHPNRFAHAAGLGAVLGVASAITDNTDDDTFSTAGKAIKGAALGVAASYGGELALGAMGITSKHLVKSEVEQKAKKVMSEVDEVKWQNNMKMKAGVAGAISIAAIGVASLVDIGSHFADERKASVQRNQQEQDLVQRQNAEKKRQSQMGYGYVDYGQIVIQQWQKRVGHYAMGNAKFQ